MRKNRQLYKQTSFNLPIMQDIQYAPFKPAINKSNRQQTPQTLLNEVVPSIKPTYRLTYNSEFQIIIGGENMYPLFMDLNDNILVICSHDFFIVINIDVTQDINSLNENPNSFIKSNVKLGLYNKIILNQPPSCIYAAKKHIYLGMNDGKILCYDIARKNLTGTCDTFTFPIMQIRGVSQNQLIVIDCAGNIRYVEYSHKTFMDKIIKTLTNTKDICVLIKTNKREKIKKFFSKAVYKKDQTLNQNSKFKNQLSSTQTTKKQVKGPQSNDKGVEENPYFYTRIQIPSQQLRQLLIEGIQIIAVVRMQKVSIISCTQNFQFIQQQTIMENPQSQVGMLEFGVGGFQNSNNTHLLLVFSINNNLFYYKGIQTQESYEWVFISQTQFQHQVIDGKFISNNLLVVLTSAQVTICNVSENPQTIHQFLISKFSYIDFLTQEEGLHFDKNLVNKFLLRTINSKNEFFCLEGKRLLTGKIDSWKEYLQRYVEEQKFNEAIIMSLKIYNRQMKQLCGINQKEERRNQEMKEFFQKIALTYVSYEIKKENYNQKQMLQFCFHYLIKTECFQYLFTTIYQIFVSLKLQEEFLQKINEYAMKREIKVMTEQLLDKMVRWYKQRESKDKLQIMVQNFDLQLMDKSILLILCLKQHLYHSMIFICNQHNDFISPILKLCGIFFTQNLSQKDKENIKQIIFYYLKECLLGHNTDYGNSKAYIQMLIQVINFVFIPSTLDMLVGISTSDTLKAINMFFQTKILQYILENQGQFFIKKNDYVHMNIFQASCINQFKVYEKMLSTLLFILDQNQTKYKQKSHENLTQNNSKNMKQSNQSNVNYQSLYFEVNNFLSYLILKNQFPFEVKYKINSVQFFIDTLSFKFKHLYCEQSSFFQNAPSIIFIQKSKKLNNLAPEKQHQLYDKEIEVNAYFMRLMDSLLRSLESNDEQKTKTLNVILKKCQSSQNLSHLLEGKCYLLNEIGKESQVLKTYISMVNPILKNKVFEYLEFNLGQSTELRQQFINNLDSIFNLNKQKTNSLLNSLKLQSKEIDNIIENLNSYPDLQLQYIEQILNSPIELPESKKNKYALLHLQIVVKHQSSKLDEYIQKIDYPLEEAFKICQNKNNQTAKAYIMIKSGRNMEGLLELCQIFLTNCDQLFGLIARKKPLDLQKKISLSEQLNKLLFACQKQYEIDNQKGEKIWEKCIKKIFRHLRISQNIKNEVILLPIKQILKQIVEKTMKRMFSQMSPDFFIERFCKKFPQLPFSVFIIAFGQIFDRMEFNSELQLLELELQQRDESKIKQKLIKYSLKSHPVWSECSACGQKVSSSGQGQWSVMTHSCGCNFHRGCLERKSSSKDGDKQKKKIMGVVHLCMNEIESFVECKGIKIEHYRADKSQETAIKKKIVKLHEYQTSQGHVFDLPAAYV